MGKTLSITGGTGFLVGNYTILSVAAGVATLDKAAGVLSAVGGTGLAFTAAPSIYFVFAARADLNILDHTLDLTGGFRIEISTSKIEVQAGVLAQITIPGAGTPLFSLIGSAAFAIDSDGFYGIAQLSRTGGDNSSTQVTTGFNLSASFLLEFNTAGISKSIQTFGIDTTSGDISDGRSGSHHSLLAVITVSLPAQTLHLGIGGDLSFSTSGASVKLFDLSGRFDLTIASDHLDILANVHASGPGRQRHRGRRPAAHLLQRQRRDRRVHPDQRRGRRRRPQDGPVGTQRQRLLDRSSTCRSRSTRRPPISRSSATRSRPA